MIEKEFLEVIQTNIGLIHKICKLYRDSKEDREDLFQEIILQLWKAFPSFQKNAKISTWIYKIALNTAVAIFRKKKLAVIYSTILPEYIDDEPNEELASRQEQLFTVIKQLNDSEKAILTLYFEELSYKEIAEIIGISENNVNVKMNRIRIKIQKLLIK
ncbi:RNA polymerase sigma factor [Pedobacter arcticus]|uniref:RNA polymerase sigma factor n=1 Tax=Pedobacter arcticus TaxID=752140 RepID=UPI0002D7A7A8|nr:sigma-70 family RNA polymerase sigma factor [Pedobacter arcticus]